MYYDIVCVEISQKNTEENIATSHDAEVMHREHILQEFEVSDGTSQNTAVKVMVTREAAELLEQLKHDAMMWRSLKSNREKHSNPGSTGSKCPVEKKNHVEDLSFSADETTISFKAASKQKLKLLKAQWSGGKTKIMSTLDRLSSQNKTLQNVEECMVSFNYKYCAIFNSRI